MESVAHQFCAFTVAISLEWHPWTQFDSRTQWSPTALSLAIGEGPYGRHYNFNVNPEALHQGLYIFKKVLKRLKHELVPMGGMKNVMQIATFMDLPERSKGINIIFVWEQRSSTTMEEAMDKIRTTANFLLCGIEHRESDFRSLGELCGSLWQESILKKSATVNTPEILEVTTMNKRRKSVDQLGSRMLSTYGQQINEFVTNNLCRDDDDTPGPFLIAALKASHTDLSTLQSISKNIFSSDVDTEVDSIYTEVINDRRVKDSISLYPKKNITFTSAEKEFVICLLDVIKEVIIDIEGLNAKRLNDRAVVIIKNVLSNHASFSELVPTNIKRWNSTRDNVIQTRGRKVYKEFEAEVWGKLMLYEFETTMVSKYLLKCNYSTEHYIVLLYISFSTFIFIFN